jgi:hypothetical protein
VLLQKSTDKVIETSLHDGMRIEDLDNIDEKFTRKPENKCGSLELLTVLSGTTGSYATMLSIFSSY